MAEWNLLRLLIPVRRGLLSELRSLTAKQRNAVITSFLGWTLDAFDFFILVLVLPNIAADFHTSLKSVAFGLTLTLAMRPVGALIFGYLADRYGRKPTLMTVIVLYSGFELACAFAPSLAVFLVLRAGFGVAMGGEWGVGSSLAMETIPARTRGVISGLLQEGYAAGYLLAAVLNWVAFPYIGWKGMFVVGACPALLVFFMAKNVEESPAWQATRPSAGDIFRSIGRELETVPVHRGAHVVLHGVQSWHAGFVSDVFEVARVCVGQCQQAGDYCKHRRDPWRHLLRSVVGAHWATARDHHCGDLFAAGDSAVGLLA